jgi:hypothetical protein
VRCSIVHFKKETRVVGLSFSILIFQQIAPRESETSIDKRILNKYGENLKLGVHLMLKAYLTVLLFFSLISLVGCEKANQEKNPLDIHNVAKSSGTYWRLAGELEKMDNGKQIKFVVISKKKAGLVVYNDAISNLCRNDSCYQVGFFLEGDSVPSETSRREFFEQGWSKYAAAAVYTNNEFTRWNCAKAGAADAPSSANCRTKK